MRLLALVALIGIASLACKSDRAKTEAKAVPEPVVTATELPVSANRYAPSPTAGSGESRAALAALLDVLVAERDVARGTVLAESLHLPQPEVWLSKTFGTANGALLARNVGDNAAYVMRLAKFIRFNQSSRKRHKQHIEKFVSAEDPAATGLQALALAAMAEPVALYSVRYSAPGESGALHLFNFVYDGTTFRYLGPLTGLAAGTSAAELQRLRQRQRDSRRGTRQ